MSNLKYLVLPLMALFSECNNHQSNVDDAETDDEIVLINAINADCLNDGELIKDPSTGEVYYQKLSVKHPNKVIHFYGNMTYSFVDGSQSGIWKCDALSNNIGSEQQEEFICPNHNIDCKKKASGMGMNLEEYHNWQEVLTKEINEEENNILESNGGEVDQVGEGFNLLSTDGYGAQNQSGHNAWQCAYCGIVSRGTEEPSGGDYGGTGGCYVNKNHYWERVNTKVGGWQCRECGTISHLQGEPSGGEFGGYKGCSNGNSHSWSRY